MSYLWIRIRITASNPYAIFPAKIFCFEVARPEKSLKVWHLKKNLNPKSSFLNTIILFKNSFGNELQCTLLTLFWYLTRTTKSVYALMYRGYVRLSATHTTAPIVFFL